MTISELWQEALTQAWPIAAEAHCRYCDPNTDMRLHCAEDLADSAKEIARFGLQAKAKALLEAAGVDPVSIFDAVYECLVSRAAEYERAAKEGK